MTAKLPLDDVRVIDLTVARAGPTCVRQLADWGADVVRVEWPADPAASGLTGGSRHSADFQHLHRNKRSLSLNLKAPAAHEVLMRLEIGRASCRERVESSGGAGACKSKAGGEM